VDDAGPGSPVGNGHSGAGHAVAIVGAVLGASHSPYAEAPWPQSLPDWIGSHVRTVAARGGVPELVVPDHLTAAVTRAPRYEPEINRSSAALARPEGLAIIPARAAKPREQTKGEVGGQSVERWRLAQLRHPTFCSRAEGHTALAPLLLTLHARPCNTLPGSRQPLCETLDRPALRPLPVPPDAEAAWQHARGTMDDHVDVVGHSDAVPCAAAFGCHHPLNLLFVHC
jgi:hypothetical protein